MFFLFFPPLQIVSAELNDQPYHLAHPELPAKDLLILAQNALDKNYKSLSPKLILAYYFATSSLVAAIYDGAKEASDQYAMSKKGQKRGKKQLNLQAKRLVNHL